MLGKFMIVINHIHLHNDAMTMCLSYETIPYILCGIMRPLHDASLGQSVPGLCALTDVPRPPLTAYRDAWITTAATRINLGTLGGLGFCHLTNTMTASSTPLQPRLTFSTPPSPPPPPPQLGMHHTGTHRPRDTAGRNQLQDLWRQRNGGAVSWFLLICLHQRRCAEPANHRLNMEVDLQSLFGLHVTWCAQLYSLAETSHLPPPPAFGLVLRGRYSSAKIDDISL